MKEFFKLQRDPEVDNAAYGAKVDMLFSDMNTELCQQEPLTYRLNYCMIISWQQRELNARSSAKSGNRSTTSETNTLPEKLCSGKGKAHPTTGHLGPEGE